MFYNPLTGRVRIARVLIAWPALPATTDAGEIAWPALPATIAGADGSVLRRSRSLAAQRLLNLEPSTFTVQRRTP
jgi:hypothetical protein